jgi:hypothetical protein
MSSGWCDRRRGRPNRLHVPAECNSGKCSQCLTDGQPMGFLSRCPESNRLLVGRSRRPPQGKDMGPMARTQGRRRACLLCADDASGACRQDGERFRAAGLHSDHRSRAEGYWALLSSKRSVGLVRGSGQRSSAHHPAATTTCCGGAPAASRSAWSYRLQLWSGATASRLKARLPCDRTARGFRCRPSSTSGLTSFRDQRISRGPPTASSSGRRAGRHRGSRASWSRWGTSASRRVSLAILPGGPTAGCLSTRRCS